MNHRGRPATSQETREYLGSCYDCILRSNIYVPWKYIIYLIFFNACCYFFRKIKFFDTEGVTTHDGRIALYMRTLYTVAGAMHSTLAEISPDFVVCLDYAKIGEAQQVIAFIFFTFILIYKKLRVLCCVSTRNLPQFNVCAERERGRES